MKEPRLVLAYSPLAQSKANDSDPFLEQHTPPSNAEGSLQICLEGTDLPCGSEPPQCRDPYRHQYSCVTNDFPDYRIPNFGIDPEGTFPHDLQPTNTPHVFVDRNDCAFLRGVENYDDGSRKDFRNLEAERCENQLSSEIDCQYNTQPRSNNFQSETVTPMQSSRSTRNAPGRAGKPSYTPFRGMFGESESARNFRKVALRFDRKPYRPPDSDPTIWKIENERLNHVKRIYDAMIRPDAAKDNPKSNAMRRWVEDPFYDSALVEAYAHQILDCLLAQAKEGFRGWKHDDYTQDERKGEVEDTEVSCEERLSNVIRALEEEKTICEDVMNSACQIRMFVNAPKAYAGRKLNNRVGNSKRKRGRDHVMTPTTNTEEPPKPTKTRRPNTKQAKKPRHSTPRGQPQDSADASHTPEPTYQERALHPQPRQLASSPIQRYLAPNAASTTNYTERHMSIEGTPFGHQVNSMSPAQPHAPHIPHMPRINSMPPQPESPFMSPLPPLSHFSASAPVTPEQRQSVHATFDFPWQQPGSYGHTPYPTLSHAQVADNPLFGGPWSWQESSPPTLCATPGAFQFGHTSNHALFSPSVEPSTEPNEGGSFQEIWSTFPGVQQYPNLSLPELDPNLSQK